MAFKKGYTPWNKGLRTPEETKLKISLAHKGREVSEEHRKHLSEANKNNPKCKTFLGKHHTEEWKRKMSDIMKEKAPWKGKHLSTEHREKILNNKNIKKVSRGEKEVLAFVKENFNGNIIENDRKVLNGFELDIYIPEAKLAIEYLGEYWHGPEFPAVIERDAWKRRECRKRGIALLDIWENNWKNDRVNVEKCIVNLLEV